MTEHYAVFLSVLIYLLLTLLISVIIIILLYVANVEYRQTEGFPKKDTHKTIYRFKDYIKHTYFDKPLKLLLVLVLSFILIALFVY